MYLQIPTHLMGLSKVLYTSKNTCYIKTDIINNNLLVAFAWNSSVGLLGSKLSPMPFLAQTLNWYLTHGWTLFMEVLGSEPEANLKNLQTLGSYRFSENSILYSKAEISVKSSTIYYRVIPNLLLVHYCHLAPPTTKFLDTDYSA